MRYCFDLSQNWKCKIGTFIIFSVFVHVLLLWLINNSNAYFSLKMKNYSVLSFWRICFSTKHVWKAKHCIIIFVSSLYQNNKMMQAKIIQWCPNRANDEQKRTWVMMHQKITMSWFTFLLIIVLFLPYHCVIFAYIVLLFLWHCFIIFVLSFYYFCCIDHLLSILAIILMFLT